MSTATTAEEGGLVGSAIGFLDRHRELDRLVTTSAIGRRLIWKLKARAFSRIREDLLSRGSLLLEFPGFRMSLDPESWHDLRLYALSRRSLRYEPGTTQILERLLRPGMTFVDVGANNGYYSLLAASLVGPSGRVVSFEPAPAAFGRLQRNVALNGFANILTSPLAIGERPGSITLFVMPHNDSASSGIYFGREFQPITAAVSSLDSELGGSTADVAKIDVEGFECEALLGMKGLIGRSEGIRVICEYNYGLVRWRKGPPNRLFELLQGQGLLAQEILENGTLSPRITDYRELRHAVANLLCGRALVDWHA